MTGLNHVTTGVVIALVARRPEIALPLALVSHFVLDSVPHSIDASTQSKKYFRAYLVAEVLAMTAMTVTVMWLFPGQRWLIAACGLAAFLPDLLWPFYLNGSLRDKPFFRPFYAFHQKIQWSETSRGWAVEALYLSVLIIFIVTEYQSLHI